MPIWARNDPYSSLATEMSFSLVDRGNRLAERDIPVRLIKDLLSDSSLVLAVLIIVVLTLILS